MLRAVVVGASVFVLGFGPLAIAQPRTAPAAASANALAGQADAAMASYPQFSGVVLVAKDGKPVFRKAYGLANREWNVANTPETKFRLGSLTKAFTAAAILQLQEQGKLSVDDPISKHYPAAPEAWKAVTLKHLLTHTSGIPSYTGLPTFFAKESRTDRTPDEIVQLTASMPLEFEPGTKYAYDNTGYVLLGYVIERVSGERYADYVERHIFQPLGMKNSGYDSTEKITPLRAAGYDSTPTGLINARFLSMSLPYAAGSLYSTVDDMLIWDQALRSDKVLKEASRKAMFSDYGNAYGFGWGLDKRFDHARISHGGGINGFVTKFDRYPDDNLTVVVLSNVSNGPSGVAADELGAIFLGRPARTASPAGEAAVKGIVNGMLAGEMDYSKMSEPLARNMRAQMPGAKRMLGELGPLKSIAFVRADASGADRYKVTFEKGALEIGIVMGEGDRINAATMRPL
jgi:CubicO group peptidase (beta-lactamase class C family)